jgi:two-component system, chemotaxis family, sensor kinase CheA
VIKLQEKINEARKHGHNLYKVTIGFNRDLGDQNISPVKFFKKIQSVGEIIDSFIDISQVKGLDNVMQSDVFFTFVFTTVLEKKLLPIALDIQEENFEVMETYEKETQPSDIEDEVQKENITEKQTAWAGCRKVTMENGAKKETIGGG